MSDVESARRAVQEYLARAAGDFCPGATDFMKQGYLRSLLMSGAEIGGEILPVYDDQKAPRIIEIAKVEPDAAAVLREIVNEHMNCGHPLPVNLASYVRHALVSGAPNRKFDRRKPMLHKVQLVCAIDIALRFGLSSTRNDASFETESACSLVSSELRALGIVLSPKRLAEYWAELADFRRSEDTDPSPA